MTHVVCEACIATKRTDCVDVCPVDSFRDAPDECIDCAVCVPECPEAAIYAEEDVPADQQEFIELNRELARQWPSITHKKPYPDDADQWRGVKNKLQYLKR